MRLKTRVFYLMIIYDFNSGTCSEGPDGRGKARRAPFEALFLHNV